MPSHPFSSGKPPEIPSGSLRQRAAAYIHRFPDHWGKKSQLTVLYDRHRLSVFRADADTAIEADLSALLDLLDGLYLLHPWGPPSSDNPWNPVERSGSS